MAALLEGWGYAHPDAQVSLMPFLLLVVGFLIGYFLFCLLHALLTRR